MQSAVFIVPAFQAAATVEEVVRGLQRAWRLAFDELLPEARAAWSAEPICVVIDDGSWDGTGQRAAAAGALVLRHEVNRGKGAALGTGLTWAEAHGHEMVVSVDADGQHPPEEAVRLMLLDAPRDALVLGVRDLVRDGAPWPNRFSNGFSNLFLSLYGRMRLQDTQCGLRRYPVRRTLELRPQDSGYAFEAEVVLRMARLRLPIVQEPVRVIYPPEDQRVSHFHSVRDPARIVRRVLWTVASVRLRPRRSG